LGTTHRNVIRPRSAASVQDRSHQASRGERRWTRLTRGKSEAIRSCARGLIWGRGPAFERYGLVTSTIL